MGRRHLSRLAAAGALALALAPPAGAAVTWRTIADGPSPGPAVTRTTALIALTRTATARFSARLSAPGPAALARLDFSRYAVVAIFGEFGCADGRVAVTSIVQKGVTLAIKLVQRALAPGTLECMAIFATYRLLAIPKSLLHRPFPTTATVTVARA